MTETATHAAYHKATDLLREATDLAGGQDFEQAIGVFRVALETLGHEYADPQVLDDSEMKVIVAELRQEKGDAQAAAQLLRTVLEARLRMYRRKHNVGDQEAEG